MRYFLEYNRDDKFVKKYIDDVELNKDRKEYLKIQNDVKCPILFCTCCGINIPMLLTNHEPTPHFQTKSKQDKGKHYYFCRHYINEEGEIHICQRLR